MDHIDTKILRCLTQDARMNASQISAQVNLSVSAVIERMKKLESSGLIRGYTAVIDERLAGYDVQALISIRLEHPKYNQSFAKQMCDHSRVMECFYITGDFDYMARVCEAARNPEAVRLGPSPRALLALMRCCQALACIRGRDYVIPDDVKELAVPVLAHRIVLRGISYQLSTEGFVRDLLNQVAVPTEKV